MSNTPVAKVKLPQRVPFGECAVSFRYVYAVYMVCLSVLAHVELPQCMMLFARSALCLFA